MNSAKVTAVRLIVEAIGVLLLAVFVVARYEEHITAINWKLVSIVMVTAMALFAFYRWQMREDNSYDALQMFMIGDVKTGHADLNAHIVVIFAGLAVWLVIQQALSDKPVVELALGVLGIFVAGKAAKGFSDAMQNRGAPVDQSQNVNVLPGAKISTAEVPPVVANGQIQALKPQIGPEDVGKNVAIVSPSTKRSRK